MIKPADGCNWGQHVRAYFAVKHKRFVMLRYEDLLGEGSGALATAMGELTSDEPDKRRAEMALEKYAFGKLADRKPGVEIREAFMRKGTAGDWRNHFNREVAEIFDHHCGDMLIEAGYERDRSWVEQVPPMLEARCGTV